jgi:HAD superfamily phosphatase (TIGR01681 family)
MARPKPSIVVLDLDETLVTSIPAAPDELEQMSVKHPNSFFVNCASPNGISLVRKRKHVDHFISELKRNGKIIVVWSAGTEVYVKTVCNILFGRDCLDFILTGNHFHQFGKKKDISVLGKHNVVPNFNLNDAVLIDDRASNGADNPNHIIVVKPFEGEEDDELLRVLKLIV